MQHVKLFFRNADYTPLYEILVVYLVFIGRAIQYGYSDASRTVSFTFLICSVDAPTTWSIMTRFGTFLNYQKLNKE